MNESLPMKTINRPNGDPYISIIDEGETFAIQLHRYGRVVVQLDKKVIPELIEYLMELKNERTN